MPEREQREGKSENEMDAARGLAPAEKRREPVERDAHLGRHRKACQHDERRQDEKYRRVSELLQRIVLTVLRRSFADPEIVERHRQQLRHVSRPQDELRDVAGRTVVYEIK